MPLVLIFFLILAMLTLFFSGYYIGVLKERFGRSWLMFVPILIAIFMFNVIWALTELAKSPRWQ